MVVELLPFGIDPGIAVKGHIGGAQRHLFEGAPIVETAEIIGHLRLILKVNTSPCFRICEKGMALFAAEVRHVYGGHGVTGKDLQHMAGRHGFQALSGFQHWQGAKKPRKVHELFKFSVRHGYCIGQNHRNGSHPCRNFCQKRHSLAGPGNCFSAGTAMRGWKRRKWRSLELLFSGIKGDMHAGLTRKSDVRTIKQYARDTDIRNVRQLTIVSEEELAEIADLMGIPEMKAEWLGANVVTSGIPDLTLLHAFHPAAVSIGRHHRRGHGKLPLPPGG